METAIITGASKGIGKSIAITLKADGFEVLNASRSDTFVDVSNEWQVKNFVQAAVDTYGRVDVLVNNAGYAHDRKSIEKLSDGDWEESLATNLLGPFYFMREVIPVMMKQGHGTIINIASKAALLGVSGFGAYSASKAALIALTKVASRELAPRIFCVSVCPAATNTDMRARSHGAADAARQQSPDVIAKVVDEIIRKHTADGMPVGHGNCIVIQDGGVAGKVVNHIKKFN